MPGVRFEGVTKQFPGGAIAVDDLSFEIEDGEFMILVGSSGCGKTTALRMIAGLEKPSAGTIRIGERVVNDVSAKDRDIAMVFQNYALYPHMTVARNLAYPLRQRRRVQAARPRPRVARGRRDARSRRAAQAPARPAVGRPAPAGGDGPGARPRARGVPARRAALQPRRQAPRADARRAQAPARAGWASPPST